MAIQHLTDFDRHDWTGYAGASIPARHRAPGAAVEIGLTPIGRK